MCSKEKDLLGLCRSLQNKSANGMQQLINQYLQEKTLAETAFLIPNKSKKHFTSPKEGNNRLRTEGERQRRKNNEDTGAQDRLLEKAHKQLSNSTTSFVSGVEEQDNLYLQVIGNREARGSPIRIVSSQILPNSTTNSEIHLQNLKDAKSGVNEDTEVEEGSFRKIASHNLRDLSPDQINYIQESILESPHLNSFLAVKFSWSRANNDDQHKQHSLVVCLANKKQKTFSDDNTEGQEETQDFDSSDEDSVTECLLLVHGLLINTLQLEEEKRLKTQCQSLLSVARNLFTHLDDVSVLLRLIMSEARELTRAERCSLFLLDHKNNELVAKVFDGDTSSSSSTARNGLEENHINAKTDEGRSTNNENSSSNNGPEVRLSCETGVAGHVAKTGDILNIRDAQSHPLFYRDIDNLTGFTTRSILCFPIKDDHNQVIGVAELCNKTSSPYFSRFDEEVALAFSAYCGIAIIHSLMYKKVADAQYRSKLSNELMMYHMKVADYEVCKLSSIPTPKVFELHPEFSEFSFAPRLIEEEDTPMAVVAMLQHLKAINKFRISKETLARFILMVRRGYRDPPYHNWRHAFSVAHFCYLLVENLELVSKGYLSDLECMALFLACLCHDLDHRGTNNSFQVTSNSVLASLYSSEGSVMERHHFAQTMCILNTEGCNILENLSQKEYVTCLDLLRDIILATDLAHHLRIKAELAEMISSGYKPEDETHRNLLLCLLMTSCDLSDQAKDWTNSKNTAELIYAEFFTQGDLEKAMGNKPQLMMDRDRANIPHLQIEFIDQIAMPVYRDLHNLFPTAKEPLEAIKRNRACWTCADNALKKRGRNGITGNVREIFRDESIEREVFNASLNLNKS